MHAADALAAAWAATWIALAVVIGLDVADLHQVAVTLGEAGGVLVAVGHGLRDVGRVPILGAAVGDIGKRIATTGSDAVATSRSSGADIHQLSYLLPIVVALVPVVPVLALYVPVRILRWREARTVRAALARAQRAGSTAGTQEVERVEAYLARRAVATLPYHQLQRVSSDPWADLESGKVRALAAAELWRLGIEPSYRIGAPDEPA